MQYALPLSVFDVFGAKTDEISKETKQKPNKRRVGLVVWTVAESPYASREMTKRTLLLGMFHVEHIVRLSHAPSVDVPRGTSLAGADSS